MNTSGLPMWLLREHMEGKPLTGAEKRVLRMLAMGDTQPEIARKTGKSLETIRAQTKTARARLGAKNNAHAVAIAISLDMI